MYNIYEQHFHEKSWLLQFSKATAAASGIPDVEAKSHGGDEEDE